MPAPATGAAAQIGADMADEDQYDDETDDDGSAEEWQAEAEKWKELAAKHEKRAAENANAVAHLARLEKELNAKDDEYAERVEAAKAEGAKTAEEWRAEAARWKEAARKFEDTAKKNFAAAARVQKLEAEAATAATKATEAEAEAAETKAALEAKATEVELRAMRLEVARELRVPKQLVDLLAGSSKREIEQSADRLLRELAANKQPEPEVVEAAQEQRKAKEDSELAESRRSLTEAEVKVMRLEVAIDKALPSGLAEMLNARTREDLERQADALLAAIGGVKTAETSTRSRMPVSRLRPGALPEGANEPDVDPRTVAESIMRRSRGY